MTITPSTPRVDIWTISVPNLGFKNLKVCNLAKFLRRIGVSYSSVYSNISKAKKEGKTKVLLTCDGTIGDMVFEWTYGALDAFYDTLQEKLAS